MKKSLLSFCSAFALAIAFSLLSLISNVSLSVLLSGNISLSLANSTLITIFFSLGELAVFFGVFYFLAENYKITAMKTTVIAILLGAMLAPVVLYLPNTVFYQPYSSIYISLAAGSAISSIFQFFLPALTALLFVELRKNKSNNNPTV